MADLPADMVERAARALYAWALKHDDDDDHAWASDWADEDEDVRSAATDGAQSVLAAALEGCEVRVQWRHRCVWADEDDATVTSWYDSREVLDLTRRVDLPGQTVTVQRRITLTLQNSKIPEEDGGGTR